MPKNELVKKTNTLSDLINKIEVTINAITDSKKRGIIVNWLFRLCGYLDYEKSFNPSGLKKYYPGDIVDVDFGFNLGSELGGVHFAVVIENNNRKNPNIMVVPLSSYEDKGQIRKNEIDLGVIDELNQSRKGTSRGTRAIPNQMRIISKIRIYHPKKNYQSLGRIPKDKLQLIYDKITELYCSAFTEDEDNDNV